MRSNWIFTSLLALAFLPACQNARLDRHEPEQKQEALAPIPPSTPTPAKAPGEDLTSTPSRETFGGGKIPAPVSNSDDSDLGEIDDVDSESAEPSVDVEDSPVVENENSAAEPVQPVRRKSQKKNDDDTVLITWIDPVEGKNENVLDNCMGGKRKGPKDDCDNVDTVIVPPPAKKPRERVVPIPRKKPAKPVVVTPAPRPPVKRLPKKLKEKTAEDQSNQGTSVHFQPVVSQHVDVLFVVDTSKDMKSTRIKMAQQLPALIKTFGSSTSYKIGLLPAYGKNAGRLVEMGKTKSDVLSSVKLSSEQITEHFIEGMTELEEDATADGGQLGLYALKKAFDSRSVVAGNKGSSDFIDPRENSNDKLLVIFVSNENDICFDYASQIGKPNFNGKNSLKPSEKQSRSEYCKGVTPKSVLVSLLKVKDPAQLVMAGILNTSPSNLSKISSTGEDEMGHGYIDLIRTSVFDQAIWNISAENYNNALRSIGVFTKKAIQVIELKKAFVLPKVEIKTGTLRVFLDGQEIFEKSKAKKGENSYQFDTKLRIVKLDKPGAPGSKIEIRYIKKR